MSETAQIKQMVDVNNQDVFPISVTDAIYYNEQITNESGEVEIEQKLLTDVIEELKEKSIDSLEASKVSYTHNNNSNVEQALDNLYDMINWKVLTITPTHYKKNTTTSVSSTYEIGSVVDVTSTYTLSKNTKKYQYKKPGTTSTIVDLSDNPQNEIIIEWTANSSSEGNIKLEFSAQDINKDGSTTMISSNKSIAFKQYIYHGSYSASNPIPVPSSGTTLTKSDLDNATFSLTEINSVSVGPKLEGNGYYFLIPTNKSITVVDTGTNDTISLIKNTNITYQYTNGAATASYYLWKYENDATYSCEKWKVTIV